ncbi:MAG: carbamoyl-phosphate synthase large subunit, partial [Myxococcales bacterium]|nr:carbamoyl-phosphate synthase large subunit [Myxococcales bacterium]
IDYVVTKIPRFAFEKFTGTDETLTIQMKSVGEVMAIGRTFKESLGTAMCSLETGTHGFDLQADDATPASVETLLGRPHPTRLWHVGAALRLGVSIERVHELTRIDPWFLDQIAAIIRLETRFAAADLAAPELAPLLRAAKRAGLSDRRLADLRHLPEAQIRALRLAHGLKAVYKRIDTCAAEFAAHTPYLYSTYEDEDEAETTTRPKIVILGGGPNRIGQGIEFDYCCCHAAFALREAGYETVMVNCNPETVSTDYDTSDRLYFEPLTREHVLGVLDREASTGPVVGVLVQFGGQTPLKLAADIEAGGYKLLGTSADAIDKAEDRGRFGELVDRLGIKCPRWGVARSPAEAETIARDIGFPVLVRPSYVLGGRAMRVVYSSGELAEYMRTAVLASPDHPVLVDEFLHNATEFDVDAVADADTVVIAGIMEHIEEAGVHSGDSACSLPPVNVAPAVLAEIRRTTAALARELGVVGLMNVQYALQGETLYVLEVNPRASRTIPFVAKATGVPFAKIAARVAAGESLASMNLHERIPRHVAVKVSVFPFNKFAGVDTILGPEMRSTGEVMGVADDFGAAFHKGLLAAGIRLPQSGRVFVSVRDADKHAVLPAVRHLQALGFELVAT